MLVLSRRKQEEIAITAGGQRIVVKVIEFKRNGAVRIGIKAPRDVVIHRQEIQELIDAEQPRSE